jgi:hypothetical protein
LLGSFNSPVTGKDRIILVNENGIGEAKLFNAIGDLTKLLFRMGPGIVGPGFKCIRGVVF